MDEKLYRDYYVAHEMKHIEDRFNRSVNENDEALIRRASLLEQINSYDQYEPFGRGVEMALKLLECEIAIDKARQEIARCEGDSFRVSGKSFFDQPSPAKLCGQFWKEVFQDLS